MLKKIGQLHFSKKILAIGMLLLLAAALLPLYRLTLFTFPKYDDFGYGLNLWKEQRYGYGLLTILTAGFRTVESSYYSWQGTYSSIFMMAQMPGALGFEYYFIGPMMLISALTLSTFFMSMVLTGAYLKGDLWDRISFSVLVTLTLIECIYTAQQGFFWYNGGVHYIFMHSMMFFMVGLMVLLHRAKHVVSKILLAFLVCIFGIICAGSNFVTCIQGLLLLAGYLVLVICTGKMPATVPAPFGKWISPGLWARLGFFWYVPALYFYVKGLLANVNAPGNAHRQAFYSGFGPLKSIYWSLRTGLGDLHLFLTPIALSLLVMSIPLAWMMVRGMTYKFRLPGLFTLLSYCFYCSGFTSSYYSMGGSGLSRTWLAVCATAQVLAFVNLIYWVGYVTHNERILTFLKRIFRFPARHYVLYYLAVAAAMLAVFHFTPDKIGAVSSFGAYYYVHSGEANNLHQEFLERVEIIESSSHAPGEVVEVPSYTYMPWFLIAKDMTEDPENEENRMAAEFFGVGGISVVPREEYLKTHPAQE